MSVLTLIIGLERNYRGAPLGEQLAEIGVAHEWSPGVEGSLDGKSVKEYTQEPAAAALFGRALTVGEIGCALAHRVAYQRLLDSDAEWALVFEDDARIVRPDEMAMLFARFEALEPYGSPAIFVLYGRQVTAYPDSGVTVGSTRVHELLRPPMTTTGYFINRAAAQHILDTGLPLRNPADWPVSVAGKVQFAAAWPWPAIPDEVEVASSIGQRDTKDRRGAAKSLNRLLSLMYVKWFRKRSYYRSFGEYHEWEIRRRVVAAVLGTGDPYRVPDDAADLPVASKRAVAVDRILGGSRPGALLRHVLGIQVDSRMTQLEGADVTTHEQPDS